MKAQRSSPDPAYCSRCLAGQTVECLVRSMYPPNANHNNPGVGIDKRRRGVSIALSPAEVYPQGTGSPVESAVTISGAVPNTTFTAQVVAGANTGGHQHHDSNRPKGTLAGHGSTTCTGSSPIACTTDANGGAQLKYVSSAVGGWDTILVKMASGEEGDAIVKVRVPNLIPLPYPSMNYVRDTGDLTHPNYLYGASSFVSMVQQITAAYHVKYGSILSFNDMSLINGGLFDVGGSWTTPHKSHRAGKDVDFNTTTFYRKNGILYKVKNLTVPELLGRIKTVISENKLPCVDVKEETIHFRCD